MYLRSFWVICNLFFSVIVCSIPVLLFGWFDKNKILVSRVAKFWSMWMIYSTGIKYKVLGVDNIDLSKQYVYMSNHESALDILFGIIAIPSKIIFLAKKELFRIPLFGWAMKSAGMIKIDRQNSKVAKETVNNAVNILINSKFSTLIYPEGTRSDSEGLLPFKKGGFILAIRAKLDIVPLTIIGARDALPKGRLGIKKNKIIVIISKPISTININLNDKDFLIAECRKVIHNNKNLNINLG